MNVNPNNAVTLAWWVRTMMPGVYAGLVRKATQGAMRARVSRTLSGLGCCLCFEPITVCLSCVTPAGSCNDAGIFTGVCASGAAGGSCNVAGDFTLQSVDPSTLQPISVDPADIPAPSEPIDGSTGATDTSSGALSSVGTYLTSSAGLTALTTLATQVLKTQAAQANATAAQAVLASQVATVRAGNAPAAVSYTVNPLTGQLTPVLATGSGESVPLTQSLLDAATPGVSSSLLQIESFLSQYGIWLAAGVLVLLLVRKR